MKNEHREISILLDEEENTNRTKESEITNYNPNINQDNTKSIGLNSSIFSWSVFSFLIELNLKCVICDKNYICIFHKNAKEKGKIIIDEHVEGKYWLRWVKEPKYYFSYQELLEFYNEESNEYNLIFSNCYNFAKSISNKIE